MPQNDYTGDILGALLNRQQGDSVDPRVPYLVQLLGQGAPPSGQRYQGTRDQQAFAPFEIMRLLDPANQGWLDRQADQTGRVQQQLRLGDDEMQQLIGQQSGLALSPMESGVLGYENQKASAAQQTATTRQGELDLGYAQLGEEQRQFDATTPDESDKQMDALLKSLALGYDMQGNAVPPEISERAFKVLRGVQSMPGLSQLLSQLVKSDDVEDLESFIKLTGLPLEVIGEGFGGGSPRLSAGQGVTDEEGAMLYMQQGLEEVLKAEEEARGLQ